MNQKRLYFVCTQYVLRSVAFALRQRTAPAVWRTDVVLFYQNSKNWEKTYPYKRNGINLSRNIILYYSLLKLWFYKTNKFDFA